MPKKLNNHTFPEMKRVRQRTLSHCGPAVLEMLLSYMGIVIEQDKVVKAARVKHKLKHLGMTVEELGIAIKKIAPKTQFWFKREASMKDIYQIVKKYNFPVGVEWQGLFGKYADDDDGHYGVITYLDQKNNRIHLADPYPKFAGKDRKLSITRFEKRWWDLNEVTNAKTKKHQYIKDHHMIFLVVPKKQVFPKMLRMSKN